MQTKYSLFSLRKRILAILILISFLFFCLIIRLFFVQILNSNQLQSKALSQWTRDISIISPRGKILDSTGSTLAVSYTTYNIYARGREITQTSTIAQYFNTILDIPFDVIIEKLTKTNVSEILIKSQIDKDLAEKIYAKNFSGIYLTENTERFYPYGDLLTQVLGFTTIDNIGQTGLEQYYNDILTGINGYSFTQSDLQGKEIGGTLRYYVNSTAGDDLILTIDSKIQLILEQILNQIMLEQKAKNTTGIVLNAQTGEILAISNKPSFDLNNIPRDNIEKLFSESKIKAISDNYEPGSTFKILTLAAALEEGVVTENDHFYCGGSSVIDGVKIKCWKSTGHGSQTLAQGFANSCNCVFMNLALRLGIDKFYKYLELFGIGTKTGISLSGEANGILMNKTNVKNVDLARMGFGHAVAVTPIQLITSVSAVINGGKYNIPYIVSKISGSKNEIYTTQTKRQILSKNTSEIINKFMEQAVNKTNPYSFVEGYNVGGKTGTAQKYNDKGQIDRGKYISSFIGSYPANNPKYTIILTVDEPNAGAYYGSIVAAPYGKLFFSQLFEYLKLPKDNETVKIEYVEMPDITDLPLAQAVEIVTKLGLYYELDGEGLYVKKQLPPVGSLIAMGETIVLVTT